MLALSAKLNWRNAVTKFDAEGLTYGATLTHAWLHDAFGLPLPDGSTPNAIAKQTALKFLMLFKRFEIFMLEDRLMMLDSVHGVGYTIVKPEHQTSITFRRTMKELRKELNRAQHRLTHTNVAMLTADQRRQNDDAQTRLASLQANVARTRRIPRV